MYLIANLSIFLVVGAKKFIVLRLPSFRKAERTAKGTLLVSSLVRNLLGNNYVRRLLAGFARLQAALRTAVFTTFSFLYRVNVCFADAFCALA